MTHRQSHRFSFTTPRIRRTLERLEDRTPPSSIADVLAVAFAFESDPSLIGDLDEDLLDSQSDGETNYLEIAIYPGHHGALTKLQGRTEAVARTADDDFELGPGAADHYQLDMAAYRLATDELMQRHTFPGQAIAYVDSVFQTVAEAQPRLATAVTWSEAVTNVGAVTDYTSQTAVPSPPPYLGEGEGPAGGGLTNTMMGGCFVRLVNPEGPIGPNQGESVEIINRFRWLGAAKAWGSVSIGDGGFSVKIQGWASALYGPFFNTEEKTIFAAVNMVGLQQADGSCRIEYHEVGGSTWDYHSSRLSMGIQANLRHAGDDMITVDFRGTAGSRGGGTVGAGVGDLRVGLDVPNTDIRDTKSLRTGTTWRAYPAGSVPPLTPTTTPEEPIAPMEGSSDIPPDINLNDFPPFPG
ncbi:MAG TPA: hypothetical protein QF564_14720 [Pirellulaceae bacterium]|nr:hypothetical protein [Pirellulaceae bacterium]